MPTSLCELIDNAIDHWNANSKPPNTYIKLYLNSDRQIISIRDNAGGVPAEGVRRLIAPGASREATGKEFIGNFGVGGKRAGVALGERVVITTRYGDEPAVELAITSEWLASDSWNLETRRVGDVDKGTTEVTISQLRQGFDGESIAALRAHLEATYSKFIRQNCDIFLNGSSLGVIEFDNWAYPPNYPPRVSDFTISPDEKSSISVKISGGLILDRDPEADNYGVYFYCNDRLVVSHLKDREVGFIKGEAGVPHPDASLCRVIVELNGPPELMPWTSNKTALNYSHPTFLELRDKIIQLTTYYSTLSRRMKNDRDLGVYQFQSGNMEKIDLTQSTNKKRVVLPPVPRARSKAYFDQIVDNNAQLMDDAPWTRGIVEAMGFVDSVFKKQFDTKNRIALIILDSNLEIGLKEYIVHDVENFRPDKFPDSEILAMFRSRHKVINAVKPYLTVSESDWGKVRHYYEKRNKLVHERATVQVTDREISDYRAVVERILCNLFGVLL